MNKNLLYLYFFITFGFVSCSSDSKLTKIRIGESNTNANSQIPSSNGVNSANNTPLNQYYYNPAQQTPLVSNINAGNTESAHLDLNSSQVPVIVNNNLDKTINLLKDSTAFKKEDVKVLQNLNKVNVQNKVSMADNSNKSELKIENKSNNVNASKNVNLADNLSKDIAKVSQVNIKYAIQIGVFSSEENAKRFLDTNIQTIANLKLNGNVVEENAKWKVRIGSFDSKILAEKSTEDLLKYGIEDYFIVTVNN